MHTNTHSHTHTESYVSRIWISFWPYISSKGEKRDRDRIAAFVRTWKTDFLFNKYSLLSGCVTPSPLNTHLLSHSSGDHLFYRDMTLWFLLPRCSSIRLTLLFWRRRMWLVRVQASLWLEMGGWRRAPWQGRHVRSRFAAHSRLVLCVSTSSSSLLCWPIIYIIYININKYIPLSTNPPTPALLNTCYPLKSAIHFLIIVALCRPLPVSGGARNKFPSTRLCGELRFPAATLLCHRLPGKCLDDQFCSPSMGCSF